MKSFTISVDDDYRIVLETWRLYVVCALTLGRKTIGNPATADKIRAEACVWGPETVLHKHTTSFHELYRGLDHLKQHIPRPPSRRFTTRLWIASWSSSQRLSIRYFSSIMFMSYLPLRSYSLTRNGEPR